MKDTSFDVPPGKTHRLAKTYKHRADGKGFIEAEPLIGTWPEAGRDIQSGGAGLFSTAGDYARFAQMLLNRGSLDGARVLSPRTVEFMTADHLGAISHGTGSTGWPGYTWGLGIAVRQDKGIAPIPGSPGDFYWPGAYATYWWADPKEELVVVFMMQSPLGRHYQHLVRGLVYQAIAH
jgi:CubicO group peptidase (beta-lactamase class C family)